MPGTVVAFEVEYHGGGLDAERNELVVDGKLTVGEVGKRPVVFTSAAPLPRRGDWYGIIVHFQGLIDMHNARIEYAYEGISGGGWNRPQTLEAVTIRRVSQNGVRLVRVAEPLTLSGLEVSEAGSEGVRIQGTAVVQFAPAYRKQSPHSQPACTADRGIVGTHSCRSEYDSGNRAPAEQPGLVRGQCGQQLVGVRG